MLDAILSGNVLALIDKALTLVAMGVGAVTMFILKSATGRVKEMSDSIDSHHERITVLEHTYVSKEDLEKILTDLQRDLQGSFERAHSRIDVLFTTRKD